MIHIRIGQGWASDPALVSELGARQLAARRAAVRAIVDVLAIELDGVDIGAGRTEGPVTEGVLGMLRAIDRLASGEEHASVPFEDGAVELVLHRRGSTALLSVATLSRPSRLLAHDVEVDLPRLAEAAREAAVGFCARVAEVAPSASAVPELRALLRAASRRRKVSPGQGTATPATRTRRTRRRARDAACSFELHDERGRLATWRGPGADLASLLVAGRVAIRSPSGEEVLAVSGVPYLLLRDLAAAAARIADHPARPATFELARPGRHGSLRVSVAGGVISAGRSPPVPCDPLAFAQAVLEGALDLCAVVRGRAPAQSANELLAELDRTATQALAHVVELREGNRTAARPHRIRLGPRRASPRPLAPGRMRRITYERVAAVDVGAPAGTALFRLGDAVVASGAAATVALDPRTGALRWRGPGARLSAAGETVVALVGDGVLAALETAGGRPLFERPWPASEGEWTSMILAGDRIVVATGHEACAIDPATGSTLWAFTSPGASRLALLPLGPLLLVASDAGAVHALDRDGRVAWRQRGPGPLAAPPAASARTCLLAFDAPVGGLLVSLDPATGRRLRESPLDFAPAGSPCRFAGRIAVPGRVAGESIVAALEEDGTTAWTEPSPVVGRPALAERPGGLLAKGADGSCAALDRDGRLAWLRSRPGMPAAPGNLAPMARRALVVVPATDLDLLDGATGMPVGRAPGHAPARLHVGDDLSTWALDADGLLTSGRVRGHLAVVEDPSA